MNDIRRTILWVIFGFSMVMLWDQWQVHNGKKATFFPGPTHATVPAATPASAPAAQSGVPSVAPQANSAVPPTVSTVPAAPVVPKEQFVVTTEVMKLTFDTEGGSLVRVEFLKHLDMAKKDHNFVLLDESADRVYLAQTGRALRN